ncbi:MAG TPA: hypothetical protein VJV78_33315 [Polyangiales bacterium]|nr:hypothetical protein [Polyangiales bacterium]
MRAFLFMLGLCCAWCASARAQDEAALGERGQWLLRGSLGVSARMAKEMRPENANPRRLGVDTFRLWISPSVSLFVAKDFALGASLSIGMDRNEREDGLQFNATGFGASALFAYRIGLGTEAFILPELGLGATYVDRSLGGEPTGEFDGGLPPDQWISGSVLHAGLYVPFAVVLGPRFYAGVGPYARLEYASDTATPRGDDWNIGIGIATEFGTWL